jgi:hypothetical protein
LPAVTSTSQATLLTETSPAQHGSSPTAGSIATREVRFWQTVEPAIEGEKLYKG